jgi:hypothetical protein
MVRNRNPSKHLLMGYAVAFIGVCFYNHAKLQALKAKELQK